MADSKFGRREVLAGAGAAGALAVLGGIGTATVAKADDDTGGLLGTFFITITTAGGSPAPYNGVAGFAPGGLAVASDASGPGSTYLGAWDGGAGGFEIRYLIFQFDQNGAGVGYVRVDVKGKVHGNSISGTFKATFVPNSGPSQPAGHGTFAGKRIVV